MNKLYGWYSAYADQMFGHVVYKTSDGLTVKITEVCDSIDNPTGSWNDYVCLGEVIECLTIRPIKEEKIELALAKAKDAFKIMQDCKDQFSKTNKCFCYTCPVKNNSN